MEKIDVDERPRGGWVPPERPLKPGASSPPNYWPSPQSSGPGAEPVEKEGRPWGSPVPDVSALRTMAGGWIMADSDGMLASCNQLCPYVAAALVYFRCEESVPEAERDDCIYIHRRCLQINLEYRHLHKLFFDPARTISYDLWPEDETYVRDLAASPAYMGGFPLPDAGEELRILAGWQPGHYNEADLNRMRFLLLGRSTAFLRIPVGRMTTVATVQVDDDRRIWLDGRRVHLRGNFEAVREVKPKEYD